MSEASSYTTTGVEIKFLQVKTNLDPMGPLQLVFFITSMMRSELELSLLETLSVVTALAYTPEIHLHWASACLMVMAANKNRAIFDKQRYRPRPEGIEIGYFIFRIAMKLYADDYNKPKVLFTQYIQNEQHMQNEDKKCFYSLTEFKQLVCMQLLVCVWTTINASTKPNKADDQDAVYNTLRNNLTHKMKQANTLTGHHLINMLSSFGMLPNWFLHHAAIDKGSRNYQYFTNKYELPVKTQAEVSSQLHTITIGMSNKKNRSITKNEIEARLCKFKRMAMRTTDNRCFYMLPDQLMYKFYGAYNIDSFGTRFTQIIDVGGKNTVLKDAIILPSWSVNLDRRRNRSVLQCTFQELSNMTFWKKYLPTKQGNKTVFAEKMMVLIGDYEEKKDTSFSR